MASILAKMAVQISANTAEFNKALKDTSSNLNALTGTLKGIAGVVGSAFIAKEVGAFALEVSKLAGEAKGVQAAFDKLPNSVRLMVDLKEATGGTVSELELMKRAVMASNFDISLKALPKLLEFATLRAQQTGQSVDYLVDSIVTGIGRKSKLILDNLGISAAQLSAEFNGASLEAQSVADVTEAVGRIADRNLKTMAEFSENASTKLQRLSAEWENLKVAIGEASNESGFLGGLIDTLTDVISVQTEENAALKLFVANLGDSNEGVDLLRNLLIDMAKQNKLAFTDEFINKVIEKYGVAASKADDLRKALKSIGEQGTKARNNADVVDVDPLTGLPISGGSSWVKVMETQVVTLESLKSKLKELNQSFDETDIKNQTRLKTIGDEILKTDELIKKIEELKKAQSAPFKSAANLSLASGVVAKRIEASTSGNFAGFSIPSDMSRATSPDKIGIGEHGEDPFGIKALQKYAEDYGKTANDIKDINNELMDSFIALSSQIIVSIASSLGNGQDIGKALLKSLARFGVQYGAQLIAVGIGKIWEGIMTENPETTAKGVGGVAAGAALVAASTALGNAVAPSSSRRGSGGGFYGGGSSSNSSRGGAAVGSTNESPIYMEFRIRGSDLVAAYDAATYNNTLRRG